MRGITLAGLGPGTLTHPNILPNLTIFTRKLYTSPRRSQDLAAEAAAAESPDHKSEFEVDTAKKLVKTTVGELPLSPWMDPEFFETRNKFAKTKPETSGYKKTKFQQTLRRNPYAIALATPPRRCAISVCTLPNFFFQRFKLVQHPETEESWFIPQGLGKPRRMQDPTLEITTGAAEAEDNIEEATEDANANEADSPMSSSHSQKRPKGGPTPGPSAYTLNSRRLLQQFQIKSSPYSGQHRKLLRMNDGNGRFRQALNNARWRADTDSALLDMVRKRIVERLLECAISVEQQGRKYIQPCTWDNVHEFNHRGCLVYLGNPESSPPDSQEVDLPPISALTVKERKYGWKIAVHDLRVLLGQEYISQLRKESALLRDGSLFLLGRSATQPLQLLLWKLQGYLYLNPPDATPEGQPNTDSEGNGHLTSPPLTPGTGPYKPSAKLLHGAPDVTGCSPFRIQNQLAEFAFTNLGQVKGPGNLSIYKFPINAMSFHAIAAIRDISDARADPIRNTDSRRRRRDRFFRYKTTDTHNRES